MSDPYYEEEDRRRQHWSDRYDAYNSGWAWVYFGLLISSVIVFMLGVFFSTILLWVGVGLFVSAFVVCMYCFARIAKGPPPGWEP